MSLKKERNKACGRGQLSPEIERKSRELLGYAISQQELRLMPYVQHCAMNEGCINQTRVNPQEREILRHWESCGFGGFCGPRLDIEKSFWFAINEILWLGYVMPVCGGICYSGESST
ncbi:hypothetical protein M8W81_004977 [Salmonella enterica]|nr:hypothetical protein [Salmonella enterica]EJF6007609.1 hypothetical protein [Salmonella enterica]EJF6164993.1 hypothetical protein [Salmonella enterica]